jgi:tetratricopeptide (TPR) repeat protein
MSTADPVEELLSKGRVAAAAPLLEQRVASMPQGWSPRVDLPDRLEVAFWDKGEFLAFVARTQPKKNVVWKLPSYSRYCYYLCFAAVERQDLAAATRWIDRALELEPDHSLILSEKALILGYVKRRPEAMEHYRRAIAAMPWYPLWTARAHRGLGFELIEEQKLDEAETEFRRSLELEPNHPVAVNELRVIADIRKGGVTGLPSGLTRGGGQAEAQNN